MSTDDVVDLTGDGGSPLGDADDGVIDLSESPAAKRPKKNPEKEDAGIAGTSEAAPAAADASASVGEAPGAATSLTYTPSNRLLAQLRRAREARQQNCPSSSAPVQDRPPSERNQPSASNAPEASTRATASQEPSKAQQAAARPPFSLMTFNVWCAPICTQRRFLCFELKGGRASQRPPAQTLEASKPSSTPLHSTPPCSPLCSPPLPSPPPSSVLPSPSLPSAPLCSRTHAHLPTQVQPRGSSENEDAGDSRHHPSQKADLCRSPGRPAPALEPSAAPPLYPVHSFRLGPKAPSAQPGPMTTKCIALLSETQLTPRATPCLPPGTAFVHHRR